MLALALAAALATLAPSAQADTITFDPTGTAGAAGDIPGVTALDFASTSILNQGMSNAVPTAPVTFNSYYESVMNAVEGTGGPVFGTGGNPFLPSNNTFTAVAGFRETASAAVINQAGNSATTTYTLASAPGVSFSSAAPNYFQILAKPAVAGVPSNTTGTGFNTGTVILQGFITPNIGSTSIGSFAVNGTTTGGVFTPTTTQFTSNPNPLANPTTGNSVTGIGSNQFTVQVTFANANFFPIAPVSLLFSTTNTLAFASQQPAGGFFNGTSVVPPVLGTTNGLGGAGTDLEVSSASHAQVVVPEPSAILQGLTAAGLLSSLAFLKRRQTKLTVA